MKHKVIPYLITLQLIAALLLLASLYIRILPLELLLSFTPQLTSLLLVSLLATTTILLVSGRLPGNRRLAWGVGLSLAAGLYILFAGLAIQRPTAVVASKKTAITFTTFNKLYSNTDITRAAVYLRQQHVDVIALQETKTEEITELQELMGFKHSLASDRISTARGTIIGIISRYPITSTEKIELTNGPSLLRAVISVPGSGDVAFYGVHLPGPFNTALYRQRDGNMALMASALQREKLPSVLGGDFNTTIFSPALREFNKSTKNTVQHTITEHIPGCSWYGLGAPLCVRIDHVYIPANARLLDTTISPDLGSDHRAVTVRFTL